MITFGNSKKQYERIKPEIDQAVKRVFESGWFILGKELEAFEQEFASYCCVKYAIGVGSGTEALHLSLAALGIGQGDEVITVPNTAVFTVSAISFAGAKPVFVDIHPKTYTIDVSQIEKAITKKTKAILPVHLYGQCSDMEAINKLAQKHNLYLVEDACQAHGAEYKRKKAGTIGDVGCFSFYPSKNLGGYGDGGMIVTNNASLCEKLKLLRNGGQEKRYFHKIKGFNSRLDEIQASILRVKLEHLDDFNQERVKIAELYNRLITNPSIVKPFTAKDCKHVFHLYVIRSEKRDEFQKFLKDKDVETFIHYPIPVHMQEAYKELGIKEGSFPVAEEYAKKILSLPMYPELDDEKIKKVADAINGF